MCSTSSRLFRIGQANHARYPDRLAGEDIPLAARIVAIGDVYDALRSRRVYKPALPHAEAMRVMAGEGGRQFDPALHALFQDKCADRFDRLFQKMSD